MKLAALIAVILSLSAFSEVKVTPISKGLLECHRGVRNPYIPGTTILSLGDYREESLVMAVELDDSEKRLLTGFYLYSENGALYFPKPSETSVRLLEQKGFSKIHDKYAFKDGKFRTVTYSEREDGAKNYSFPQPYAGPMISTSRPRDGTEIADVKPHVADKEKAEAAIVHFIKNHISYRVDGRLDWIKERWEDESWKNGNTDEKHYKWSVHYDTKELIEELKPCLDSENTELAEFAKKKVAALEASNASVQKEIDALKADFQARTIPRSTGSKAQSSTTHTQNDKDCKKSTSSGMT